MNTQTLRGIAKSYADSQIDRGAYILERRRMIDGIVTGEIELVPYHRPIPERAAAPEIFDGDDTLKILRDEPRRGRFPKWMIPVIVIVIVIVTAAALSAWVFAAEPNRVARPPAPIAPAARVKLAPGSFDAQTGFRVLRALD